MIVSLVLWALFYFLATSLRISICNLNFSLHIFNNYYTTSCIMDTVHSSRINFIYLSFPFLLLLNAIVINFIF